MCVRERESESDCVCVCVCVHINLHKVTDGFCFNCWRILIYFSTIAWSVPCASPMSFVFGAVHQLLALCNKLPALMFKRVDQV